MKRLLFWTAIFLKELHPRKVNSSIPKWLSGILYTSNYLSCFNYTYRILCFLPVSLTNIINAEENTPDQKADHEWKNMKRKLSDPIEQKEA